MPPRPRRETRDESVASASGSADDVRRFAELVRAQEKRQREDAAAVRRRADDERRRAQAAEAEARRVDDARVAKAQAAARLRGVRARGSNSEVAAAEAAYKQALADLLAIEQGERPSWAPAPVPSDAVASDAEPDEAEPDEAAAEPREPAPGAVDVAVEERPEPEP